MKNWIFTDESNTINDIVVFGYISERNTEDNKFKNYASICREMIDKYGDQFINHIKGNFVILVPNENGFKIYSDRFAVCKFFYWIEKDRFIISNSIQEITSRIKTKLSIENMAVYSLVYHFTGGRTAFEGIWHNQPGEILEYNRKEKSLHKSLYWQAKDLLEEKRDNITISQISKSLTNAVKVTLPSENISLSLTGGADTRNLLSIMLSIGKTPHLYTYGNPLSSDCIAAHAIANGLHIEHSIHDIKMDVEKFEQGAKEIIINGNGLASIHRAHRIMAVEKERQFAEYMYLGTLGGEFIKGVSEDNYIVPPVVYNNWNNQHLSEKDLIPLFDSKRVKWGAIDMEKYIKYLEKEPFMSGDVVSRKYHSLTHITAHLHDAQDVNLYKSYMKEVYTPFLDIDYLELVFKSQYTFNNKEEIKNRFLRRVENPLYGSNFLNVTYKPLTKFKYAGEHKPSEVLKNKYIAAFIKYVRQKVSKSKPANFPLGEWMEQFVEKNLPLCINNPEINATFDIRCLMEDFRSEKHIPKESYWLKYTNPIMMKMIADEFLKEN